jgi:hypothetical protein
MTLCLYVFASEAKQYIGTQDGQQIIDILTSDLRIEMHTITIGHPVQWPFEHQPMSYVAKVCEKALSRLLS